MVHPDSQVVGLLLQQSLFLLGEISPGEVIGWGVPDDLQAPQECDALKER